MLSRFSLPFLLTPLLLFATDSTSEMFSNLKDEICSIAQSAKHQRANIDYLPYIMTVFDGEELSRAGAASLKEALSLVAGVNIASDNLSLFNPVFRGSNPVAYGQTKLVVDGVEVNDLFFDGYTAYLTMPIDMIKRIEIVRGPGSYSNGHWGYAGSIVVTTYKKEAPSEGLSRWFTSAGSYGTLKAGGTYAMKRDDFAMAVDVYTVHDNLSLSYGKDGLSNNLLGAANSRLARSGNTPSATDATMASISLNTGDFFVNGRLSSYKHGSEGGINYALASDGDHYNVDQWRIQAGFHYDASDFKGTLQAEMVQDSFISHSMLAPSGLILPSLTPPTVIVSYPDGFYGNHEAFIRTYRLNNTLSGTFAEGEATFGITASRSSVTSEKTLTTDRNTGTGMTDYSSSYPFFDPNGSINDIVGYLTYEKLLSPAWTVYASLTLDRRNGLSVQTDPRLAAIYTVDPTNLFKVSVSRAHRNPSWQEMFTLNNRARWGNPELLPETVMAYEAQYIHQFETDHTLSVNLFRLNNKNQITPQYDSTFARYEYVNGSESTIKGIEAEWHKRYDTTTFYAAYTHIWAKNGNGATLANAPSDTARGFVTHNLNTELYGSIAGRYQSAIPRAVGDTRSDMNAIGIVDASIGYKLPSLGSEVQLTLKNLFDRKECYPSPANTYQDDYPAIGRMFLITLRGTF